MTVIPIAAANFRAGRPAGLTPEAIVLHRSGTRGDLRSRFASPSSGVSSHYIVGRDGGIDQGVAETDTAFHAGLIVTPTWTGLRANVNPNFHTISIELEGSRDDDWPDSQIAAAATLIAAIAGRWQIAIDAGHVVTHSAIRAGSGCPSNTLPLARLLAAAQATDQETGGTTDGMELGRQGTSSANGGFGVAIDRTTLTLTAKDYLADAIKKDLLVLHFTAGTTARSAFDTWRNDPQRIATAYIVDTDGTIYEVFPPRFWAAHLGVKGTNNAHDRRSIGIEIANVGPLQRSTDDPSVLNWWPKKSKDAADFTTKFCGLDESSRYVATTYRQKTHFASFPDVQVDAVAGLVKGLCAEFGIAAMLPPVAQRYDCDLARFSTYRGICTHANFRQDKWDIGPAFPWDRLGL